MDEDDPRWDELRERERQLEELGWWEPDRPDWAWIRDCERGLIESAKVQFDSFLERATELFRSAPIRRLQLVRPSHGHLTPEHLSTLAGVPELTHLRELDLSDSYLWDAHLECLLESPYLTHLQALNLRDNPVMPEGAHLLSRTRSLPNLSSLELGDCCVQDSGLAALLTAPFAPQLTELALDLNDPEYRGVTDEGLRLLAATPLPRLHSLALGRTYFTAEGVAALAHSENLPALSRLGLGAWMGWIGEDYRPRERLVEALVSSPLPARLKFLDLLGQRIGPEGAALLSGADLPRLRHLDLGSNRLGDEGLRVLLGAPWSCNLRSLRLWCNDIGPEGIRALASATLPSLRELDLSENAFGHAGAVLLANAPLLSRLTTLDIFHCRLDVEALRTLLTSPYLSSRTVMRPNYNAVTREEREELCRELGGAIRCRVEWWG
jgi:Ran GTPase-activating protein (RanGAP) involved in mRNA processing and transport